MLFILSILLVCLWFIGTPILWVVCLCRYLAARKQSWIVGGEYWRKELSRRKTLLIVMSVIWVGSFAVVFGLEALSSNSIAYM